MRWKRGAVHVAAFGTRVEVCRADVSKSAAVQGYVAAALKAFGRIDGLFSNAGIEGHIAPTHEYDEDEFDRVQAVNTKGVFLGMRHVLPLMIAQGSGSIVNTASIGSERGLAGACTYNAAKHAVVGLTRTAAAEVGAKGVRVNCVMPGVIDTPLLESVLRAAVRRRHRPGQAHAGQDRAAGTHRQAGGSGRGGRIPAFRRSQLRHRRGLVHRRRRFVYYPSLIPVPFDNNNNPGGAAMVKDDPLPVAADRAAERQLRRGVLRSQYDQLPGDPSSRRT